MNAHALQSRCYSAALGSNENSSSPVSDFCYEDGYWSKTQDCILQQCSTLDRYSRFCSGFAPKRVADPRTEFNKIQTEICDQPTQTREKRFYLLLAAEIPAWICPLLRLFASWKSPDGLRLDDYVLLACGVW